MLYMNLQSSYPSCMLCSEGGDGSVVERRTRDRKLVGSSPGMSGRNVLFSGVKPGVKPHVSLHVCFAVTCYLHVCQNDRDL